MALAEAEMGLTDLAMQSGSSNARFIGDETMLVKFYRTPKLDKGETDAKGRPIYKDVVYVSIKAPGSRDAVARPARQMDMDRWPKHYAAFMNKQEEFVEGTPLEQWPSITRGQVEELKYFNVQTVEQLAEMSDSHAQKFMAIGALRSKAKLFIEAAKDSAVTDKLQSELQERDETIDALKLAVAEQGERIQALTEQAGDDDTPKRKRRTESSSS